MVGSYNACGEHEGIDRERKRERGNEISEVIAPANLFLPLETFMDRKTHGDARYEEDWQLINYVRTHVPISETTNQREIFVYFVFYSRRPP